MRKLILSLIVFLFSFLLIAGNVSAKNTLGDLKKDLNDLKAKYNNNQSEKAKTKNEIKSAENNINNAQKEISDNNEKIDQAKIAIEVLNLDIAKTEESIKELMKSYQIASGDNVYLEYVFNSTSYADMVYRYALVKQIADYGNNQMALWNNQIEDNKQLQLDLALRETELESSIQKLEKNISLLDGQLGKLDEAAIDIKTDIQSTQELVDTLINLGCGEDEDMEVCMAVKGAGLLRKPLVKGVISSYFGYRNNPLNPGTTSFHSGTDIAGNPEGTSVYSIGAGTVGKILNKQSCGGNIVYVFHSINGVKYTSTYMHLLKINVKLGEAVTSNTVVGTVGGGAGTRGWETCSTGAHLHLSMAKGWYGSKCESGCYTTYSSWRANLIDAKDFMKLPNKGTYWYSR